MSQEIRDQGDAAPDSPTESTASEESTGQAAERRLEELADQIGEVLAECGADDREALHDYAVSLVRERLPVAEPSYLAGGDDEGEGIGAVSGSGRTAGAATSFGYGALLFMVGPLLLLVFPPVGLMLLLAGAALIGWGIFSAIFSRVRAGSVPNP